MADAKYSPLGELLVHAVQLIEGGAVPDKSPRELALDLDFTDFEGVDPNVRIGINYLKGRMQNLEDELRRGREAYVELTTALQTERAEHSRLKWRFSNLHRDWSDAQAVEARLELLRSDSDHQED